MVFVAHSVYYCDYYNYLIIILGKFRQFDYGWIINLLKYGTIDPPDYDFSQIRAPIALFYGANDILASTEVFFFFATYQLCNSLGK